MFDLFEENVRYFPALLPIVDDEDPRLFDPFAHIAILGDMLECFVIKLGLDADTAPRMNRHPMNMSRGNPRRSSHGKIYLVFAEIVSVLINSMSLATPGLPRQKHVGAGLQDGIGLVLSHTPHPTISQAQVSKKPFEQEKSAVPVGRALLDKKIGR